MSEFRTYAIILAAGSGSRMQADQNKMLLEINGRTLLDLCLERFSKNAAIDHIFTVIAPEDMTYIKETEEYRGLEGFVAGGKTRQDSVFNGLKAVEKHATGFSGRVLVLIHDGARCFVPSAVLGRVLSALQSERCAAVATLPVTDTIRQVEALVLKDLIAPRDELLQMQTPQAADLDILLYAFELAKKEDVQATDDIALLLRIGYPVRAVCGDKRNLKLTTPADLELAHLLYEAGYFYE
ncbi:MAG: 2-C-methyl-D-erythritol 4-phosphate cytidylyltransferase [Clostridiaceae bacterium]|nr:2-C-methyl-D-erythritol 4-phosphate cytidylyltransferase [Clostridiaceae bacterium]